MAITVITDTPEQLLADIRSAIKDSTISTWRDTPKGNFTHASLRWKRKAWFKPTIEERKLKLNIIRPQGQKVSKTIYAVYHGRFAQMLLNHFDSKIDSIRISSLAETGDLV